MDKSSYDSMSPSSKKKVLAEVHTPLKSDDYNIQYGGMSSTHEDVPLIDTDDERRTICTKIFLVLNTLTIEPALFGFMFAFVMNLAVMTNMMMDKGCLYHLNYSKEICRNLSHYDTEKKTVEVLAADYSLYVNLTSFIAAFLMTFIAPWSDKYSRRIPLIIAVIGATLSDIGIILCTIYFESRLEYLILARLPTELTGGFICVLMIIFSHASEVSSEKTRTLKYTSLEIALGLGVSFGSLTGGFLYRYYGYLYVYSTVAVLHTFCFLWVLVFLEETTGLDKNMKWHEKAKDFFTCESFKSGVVATCKPREGKTRAIILLLMVSMCIIVLNYEAFASIAYVYVHHVYNWDPSTYSIASTTASLSGLVVTLTVVPILLKVFKLRDFTLGIIGAISMMAKNMFIAFSGHHKFLYYIGLSCGIFTSLTTLAVRSGISKIVDREELGRVFAFLATCEAVIPMVGTIAVTQIFNSTIDIFPNVTYSLGAILLLIPIASFIWALKGTKHSFKALSVTANDHMKEKV